MKDDEYTAMPAFLAGALIGARLALLLAPRRVRSYGVC